MVEFVLYIGGVLANDRANSELLADRVVVTSHCLAMATQYIQLLLDLRDRQRESVPAIRVLRDNSQRLLFAHATNPDGWMGLLHGFRLAHRASQRVMSAREIRAF